MNLEIRSFAAGALVVVLLWAAFAGSRSVADYTPQLAGGDVPHFAATIGPDGSVYVTYTPNGETRRVFQQNGQWVSEIAAPRWRVYRKRVITTRP